MYISLINFRSVHTFRVFRINLVNLAYFLKFLIAIQLETDIVLFLIDCYYWDIVLNGFIYLSVFILKYSLD